MTEQEANEEYMKCMDSPYYFATKYIQVVGSNNVPRPFTTNLSEEEYNRFAKLDAKRYLNTKRRRQWRKF